MITQAVASDRHPGSAARPGLVDHALSSAAALFGGRARPTDEAAAVAWLTRQRVGELMSEAFAVRLLDAADFQSAPAVRVHDGVRLLG